ncbi:prepilin-type N-terminal cleavage/methylation domain-containing protein [Patescibacteria group bacterium]|nr:prepilin-type N-terminal cleavage/methylation domain-containing protein [Patescibacteria group bacterium]
MNINNKGFTLIELLVVISIIGIISLIGVVSLNQTRENAGDAKRMADIRQIRIAIDLYYDYEGYYPTTTVDCTSIALSDSSLSQNGTTGFDELMEQLMSEENKLIGIKPEDPKNTGNFTYRYCSDGYVYEISHFNELDDTFTTYKVY